MTLVGAHRAFQGRSRPKPCNISALCDLWCRAVLAYSTQEACPVGSCGQHEMRTRSFPSFAMEDVSSLIHAGRAVPCVLRVRGNHIIALCFECYQGMLCLTDRLMDACGELNVESGKVPCLAKDLLSGEWVLLLGSVTLVSLVSLAFILLHLEVNPAAFSAVVACRVPGCQCIMPPFDVVARFCAGRRDAQVSVARTYLPS